MSSLPVPAPAPKPSRRPRTVKPSRPQTAMLLSINGTAYQVERLDPDKVLALVAYRLTKPNGELYDVALTPTFGPECSCPDWIFNRADKDPAGLGKCKHIVALEDWGLLRSPEKPRPPVVPMPRPAPRPAAQELEDMLAGAPAAEPMTPRRRGDGRLVPGRRSPALGPVPRVQRPERGRHGGLVRWLRRNRRGAPVSRWLRVPRAGPRVRGLGAGRGAVWWPATRRPAQKKRAGRHAQPPGPSPGERSSIPTVGHKLPPVKPGDLSCAGVADVPGEIGSWLQSGRFPWTGPRIFSQGGQSPSDHMAARPPGLAGATRRRPRPPVHSRVQGLFLAHGLARLLQLDMGGRAAAS